MVLISVAGSASRSLPAERGTVRLRLTADGPEGAAVVAALHARLSGEARALVAQGAAGRWSGGEVVTAVELRWDAAADRNERVRVSTARLEVRFRDLTRLGVWLGDVAVLEGVLVDGVDWALTAATRREAEGAVRTEAVRDAVERAEVYAAATGAAEVRMLHLREGGLRHGGEPSGILLSRAESRSTGFELHPAAIEVAAAVAADFETAGDASAPPPDAVRARRAARAREQDLGR